MVEVKCPSCGAVQKADENKYEVKCKKCGNLMVVEDALELLLSGAEVVDDVQVSADSPEAALEKGIEMLEAGEFAMAKSMLTTAFQGLPGNALAAWSLCRAVMCVKDIAPTEPEVLYAMGEEEKAVDLYCEQTGESRAKAEFEIRKALTKLNCYTDEESDELYDLAVQNADEAFAKEIAAKYAVYSFRDESAEEESTQGASYMDRLKDIKPNFSAQRSLLDGKVIVALVLSILIVAGASVLLALDYVNGWFIALLVVGIVAMLICALILWMDNRKTVIYKLLYENYFTTVEDLARAMYKSKSEEMIQSSIPTVLSLLYNMIASAQLTYVGVSKGKYIQYYDEDYNLIETSDEAEAEVTQADPAEEADSEQG